MINLKSITFFTSLLLLTGSVFADEPTLNTSEPTLIEFAQSVPEQTNMAVASVPDAKDVWMSMIKNAKKTIDLGQMYLNNIDEKGLANELEPVIRELELAGARGIKIRLIISEQMKNTDVATLERIKKIKNAEVRIYDLGKLTGGIIHAKFFLVDKREVFVGSQNMDWKALSQIHELGVHIIDQTVAAKLGAIFDKDWAIIASGNIGAKPNAPSECKGLSSVDVVASPPALNPDNVCDSIPVLLSLINKAKKDISIQVMEYSLGSSNKEEELEGGKWLEIDDALRAAANRGVHVRLMVSHWNTAKPAIDHLKALSLVKGIEIKIVTVPELSIGHLAYARLTHSKYMTIDDSTFWLGTSNWSKGYFYNTRGVEIVIEKPEMVATGKQIFEKIWNQNYSEYIDLKKDYPTPIKN